MFGFGKSGRGISKEEAAERNYFDILTRHFWHICSVSFWYALANILFFGTSIYLFTSYFGGENLSSITVAFLNGELFILPIVPFLPLMLTGPFTAGFTYVIRNYAKQEHAFIISDFFGHSKKNFKQSLLCSVITYLVVYLFLQALIYYNSLFVLNGLPIGVLYTIFAIVAILLTIMLFYVYPIMVTFRMKFKAIIKNAWTLTILKLPQNFIIFAILFSINAAVIYLLFIVYPLYELWLLLMAFFLTGFTAYSANYYIWEVLYKYLVKPVTPSEDTKSVFAHEEHIADTDTEE